MVEQRKGILQQVHISLSLSLSVPLLIFHLFLSSFLYLFLCFFFTFPLPLTLSVLVSLYISLFINFFLPFGSGNTVESRQSLNRNQSFPVTLSVKCVVNHWLHINPVSLKSQ